MKASELKNKIERGKLSKYSHLYQDIDATAARIISLLDGFVERFGDLDGVRIFSVPGRSEICGNHTDHNCGSVLAAAIDRDVIAIARRNESGFINFISKGYEPETIRLEDCSDKKRFGKYTSASLIAGVVDGFMKNGYAVGGFDAYSDSEVLTGSGISSSAAYEVEIGNILSGLYNEGSVTAVSLAKIAKYAENEYFGKPSGLMDQMACAVGGFVYIDFADSEDPTVEPIDFSISDKGYKLAIINTGGSHADLNDDYAAVPREMKEVAALLGRSTLSGITEDELISNISVLRIKAGDRAVLRSLHFVRECERVGKAREALKRCDIDAFLRVISESGDSSFKYLQNVYTVKAVEEQGLSLALALADGCIFGKQGAVRVHGGGFAGTVQVFVRDEDLCELTSLMESVFGKGSVMVLNVRPVGATELII